jgi:hypothetical protein
MAMLVVSGLFLVAPAHRASAAATSWTIAIYSDTDNSLMGGWDNKNWGIVPELQKLPANSQVNIVGVNSDKPNSYTIIDEVSGSTVTHVATLSPKMDMGIPSTLSWWINYSTSHWPSTYYALVLNDHGFGFEGTCWDVCFAGNTNVIGHMITVPQLQKAIADSGKKIDVLGFDACNMAMQEVVYQVSLTNLVSYVVASEEPEAYGWVYDAMLAQLVSNPAMQPKDFSITLVNGFGQYYENNTAQGAKKQSLSSIDVAQMKATIGTFSTWVAQMNALLPSYGSYYVKSLQHCPSTNPSYMAPDTIEYMWCLLNTSGITDSTLRTDTMNVISAVYTYVLKSWGGSSALGDGCHGVSFFWPTSSNWKTYTSDYVQTAFSTNTGWGNFLTAYYA